MPAVSYGTRQPVIGDVEHLGSLSIDRIESIFVRDMGQKDYRTLRGISAREFWQLNSGEVVQWTGKCWRGDLRGNYGTLQVYLKP